MRSQGRSGPPIEVIGKFIAERTGTRRPFGRVVEMHKIEILKALDERIAADADAAWSID